MPTGYTHPVQTGEVKDFPTFAMQCARAFGALIMMRDDPQDAPIPEFEPSDYSVNALREAEERLMELRAMTPEQIRAAHREAFDASIAACDRFKMDKDVQEARYRAMLEKVRAWTPPTPDHEWLKSFMEKQLLGSIDFDCGGSYHPPIEEPDPDRWWKAQVANAKRQIDRHKAEHAKEVERTNQRNAWVRALRESLP